MLQICQEKLYQIKGKPDYCNIYSKENFRNSKRVRDKILAYKNKNQDQESCARSRGTCNNKKPDKRGF